MPTSTFKTIQVVAAVIESSDGVLCVQRGLSKLKYISEKWEFPGGKIQDGEDHSEALIREISEELQVLIVVNKKILTVNHSYPDFNITMHAYRCSLVGLGQTVVLTEHQKLLWLNPVDPEFKNLDWAEADIPIVNIICGTE